MVALDAHAAFDAVWAGSAPSSAPAQEIPAPLPAAPLDEASLGTALEAPHPWAEELTAGMDAYQASAPEPVEPAQATPSAGLPAWLVDEPPPAPVESNGIDTIITPPWPQQAIEETFVAAAAADPSPMPEAIEQRSSAGERVSTTLDRLAQRVRAGEIDVSSVAPEATDAAVLASVLAALLGGSSSR
jgi:hypothetical protein